MSPIDLGFVAFPHRTHLIFWVTDPHVIKEEPRKCRWCLWSSKTRSLRHSLWRK
ncbi:hypothetical protein HanPSC8_Chr10g0412651 [Helianthus annuus]|nr:hypothetical protein HanPSC8_Chr10g0412651 [Helianthus annuus]